MNCKGPRFLTQPSYLARGLVTDEAGRLRAARLSPASRPGSLRERRVGGTPRTSRAFTLVELLVVLAILALLLSIAVPRYFGSLDRSKETVLRENLFQIRESLDKYFSDTGKYPEKIEDLVSRHYLRSAPIDPVTGSTTTWLVVPPRDADKGGVFDVKSGAAGNGKDGTAYRDW